MKEKIRKIEGALLEKYRCARSLMGDTRYRRPTVRFSLEFKSSGNVYEVADVYTDWHQSHVEVRNTKTNEVKYFHSLEKLATAIAYGYIA